MEFLIIGKMLCKSHNLPKRFSNSPCGKSSLPPLGHNVKKSRDISKSSQNSQYFTIMRNHMLKEKY